MLKGEHRSRGDEKEEHGSFQTPTGAGCCPRAEPWPGRWQQTALPCHLFSVNCAHGWLHQHTNKCSICCTNPYEFPQWKWALLSSWLKQGYGKIAKNDTYFMASATTWSFATLVISCCFLTHVKLQRSCRIHVCIVTSSFKSPYLLESVLTSHSDRHSAMCHSILHTFPCACINTRLLAANAFSRHARLICLKPKSGQTHTSKIW